MRRERPECYSVGSKGQKRSPRWQRGQSACTPMPSDPLVAQDSVPRPRDGKSALVPFGVAANGRDLPKERLEFSVHVLSLLATWLPGIYPPVTQPSRLMVHMHERFTAVELSHLGPASHLLGGGGGPMCCRIFSSVPGLYSLGARSSPPPSRDIQKCLQMLANVHRGGRLTGGERHRGIWTSPVSSLR